MKHYSLILFDLDGTLIDTGMGVKNSVAYALNQFGIRVDDKNSLNRFVGPPLHKSFENFYGFSPDKAMKAVEYYREYYTDKGIFEVALYEHIVYVLENLKSQGKILGVATSKPEIFAERVLEYVNIRQYFAFVAGAELDGSRTDKAEVIRYAISKSDVKNLGNILMVGDRNYDIIGAKKVGIDSIGAVFGYGDYEELKMAEADHFAFTPSDILKFIV